MATFAAFATAAGQPQAARLVPVPVRPSASRRARPSPRHPAGPGVADVDRPLPGVPCLGRRRGQWTRCAAALRTMIKSSWDVSQRQTFFIRGDKSLDLEGVPLVSRPWDLSTEILSMNSGRAVAKVHSTEAGALPRSAVHDQSSRSQASKRGVAAGVSGTACAASLYVSFGSNNIASQYLPGNP